MATNRSKTSVAGPWRRSTRACTCSATTSSLVDGDEARSSCYFQAEHFRAAAEGGTNFTVAGRYDDKVVRTEDGWKIAHRHQTVMWMNGNSGVFVSLSV